MRTRISENLRKCIKDHLRNCVLRQLGICSQRVKHKSQIPKEKGSHINKKEYFKLTLRSENYTDNKGEQTLGRMQKKK